MIATYGQLLSETLPPRIDTDAQYDALRARFGDLLVQRGRTAPEKQLMDLLALLIEDYDRRNALPPDDSMPGERLQFLIEHSGKTAADLLPIFGQKSHVLEALNGKRAISAPQAKKLGQLFCVNPGLFL